MKLRRLDIRNLGSIKSLSLQDLPDLVVLVGKNGAGKTYLLTAVRLLFEEFAVAGGSSAVMSDDYVWHRRATNQPIVIQATLELDEPQFRVLAEHCSLTTDDIQPDLNQPPHILQISRELHFGEGWRTSLLQLGSKVIVADDEIVPDQRVVEPPSPPDISPWKLYLFDPESSKAKISGTRLLVDRRTYTAYHS